jgi:hypothetical protein
MVQCGMGRCGMNSSDPVSAEEKIVTEDDTMPVIKVTMNFSSYLYAGIIWPFRHIFLNIAV